MTRVSTALLVIGPKSIAPWGDRAWRVSATAQLRVSATAQLVEGSNPYWIVTPTQPAQHPVVPSEIAVSAPHSEAVVDSVLFLLAAHFGEHDVEANLVESHNIELGDDGLREVAEFYELSDYNRVFLAKRLSERVRLGLTQLDDLSLVSDVVVEQLRRLGFDVEVYGPNTSAGV